MTCILIGLKQTTSVFCLQLCLPGLTNLDLICYCLNNLQQERYLEPIRNLVGPCKKTAGNLRELVRDTIWPAKGVLLTMLIFLGHA